MSPACERGGADDQHPVHGVPAPCHRQAEVHPIAPVELSLTDSELRLHGIPSPGAIDGALRVKMGQVLPRSMVELTISHRELPWMADLTR